MRAMLLALALCAGPALAEGTPIVIEKHKPAPQDPAPIVIEWLKALFGR